jgi:UDP-GlcNAc:undecaprenyl-phosphate GlcNAc-1-phosphate transferase
MAIEPAVITAACALSVALIATEILKPWAARLRWVDEPGGNSLKIHSAPVPFVGGIGIMLSCLLSLATGEAAPMSPSLGLILALSACCWALGFCDDRHSIHPMFRLGAEALIGVGLATGGAAVGLFADRAGGLHAGPGVLLVLVYVMAAINAVNMQDGLDGLAGGVTLIGCVGFAIVGARLGQELVVALAVALGGSLAAFLLYNFHPATVFLGDNGSYFVGFMVATMASLVTSNGNKWRILGSILLIGLPVFDAGLAIARRLSRGVSPFMGDRSHFYDYLIERGLSVRRVAIVSYGLQMFCVSLGVIFALHS